MGGRRSKGVKLDGWINLDKPVGMTSNQALSIVKRALNPQKAGHAGTLDPLASGILPIALGEATKTVAYVQDALKIYNFEVTWGEQRSTDDAEGVVTASSESRPGMDEVLAHLPFFTGNVEQVPPQFSAIKVDGARAYDLAREGATLELKPRIVYIETLEVLDHTPDRTTFTALCGKGTYVRAIARDLGLRLGCYGYISKLQRAAVGPFALASAISLDFFENKEHKPDPEQAMLPLQTALDDIPVLALREQEAARLKNGNTLSFLSKPDLERMDSAGIDWNGGETVTALTTYGKKAIAIVEIEGPALHPIRIFNV